MFSGIIDHIGVLQAIDVTAAGRRIVIRAEGYWNGLNSGASVAIDGVCLTVTSCDARDAAFDVVAETLRVTTLGRLNPGDRVNLQKSLAVGERIDGHFVQGHVDATAKISRIDRAAGESMWWFTLQGPALKYVIPKGSITVDGISLTVAKLREDGFAVALIPTTLEKTTLGEKKVGDLVNIETDILARTVVHHMQQITGESPGYSDSAIMGVTFPAAGIS